MTRFQIPAATFLVSWAMALALPAVADAEVREGRVLYVEHCASCHGADLQGQPEWRSPDVNGLYPAPPHDETGHTWHHDDAMLTDYIKRGGQAVLDDMNVAFTSGNAGFRIGAGRQRDRGHSRLHQVDLAGAYSRDTGPAVAGYGHRLT